jgi:hypothetical protein
VEAQALDYRRIDHRPETAGRGGIGQMVDVRDLDAVHQEKVLQGMPPAHEQLVA